ncbi:hypothetical protein [Desulfitobacterium sp. PCE1]|uniref:hypothetical protein n=1 Tax=Desulfitobacterium sp. PCE1 TaxID=146907 RepID=UPI00035FED4A|nr:hypothetical protein [Desulfitobacterium sp. PCE1]
MRDYTVNGNFAKRYLEIKGYKIISYEGCTEIYTLEKWLLIKLPYSHYWEVQDEDPNKFIGKVVSVEQFIVCNHLLDHYVKEKGKTKVWVFVIEGECVGGCSLPVTDEPLIGGVYSIDGRSWDEIHSIHALSYLEWKEQWNKKFSQEEIVPVQVRFISANDR